MQGLDILNNPFLNKGTAFTKEERHKLGLCGLIPGLPQTIQQQADRIYGQYQMKQSGLEQRIFLMSVFNENRTLFYYVFFQHLSEMMAIVYDPIIAQTIEQYSELYIQPQNAVYLSIHDQQDIKTALVNAADGHDIELMVVTDAQGILGIGDWGSNGVDISIGKLMVYTVAAGIDPSKVLPVVLDVGTDNEELLNDPLYLGNRHHRIQGAEYDEFIDNFVNIAEATFPNLYLHWEDFGRDNASNILNRYKDKVLTFNDDIQGTGIIVLAGILGALNISKEKLTDQIYLTYGAGTAGAGIAMRIYEEMRENGLSKEEALDRFYMVDKQGLLFDDMDDLTPEQQFFARKRSEFANANELTNLENVVKTIHPTILVGTSTQPGSFTKSIVEDMTAHTARPIIFPISNPTKLAEATAEDLIKWSDGKALVATGIPSKPVEYNGVTYTIGQANNALIYPGLGLGVLSIHAKLLTDQMISAAAHSLGGIVDPNESGASVLPPLTKIGEFSKVIAEAVAQTAIDEKLNQVTTNNLKKLITDKQWKPSYRSFV